jgi:hypothetical protein
MSRLRKAVVMGDTLQDLKDRDIDNLQYLLKNKKVHVFKDASAAFVASGEMIRLALLRGGVDLHALMAMTKDPAHVNEMVEEALAQNNIVIETRPYQDPVDQWRSGVYIYKNNEILAWIGGIKKGTFGHEIETTEEKAI